MEFRAGGSAGRVRGSVPDAHPRPRARLAPSAPGLAHAGAVAARVERALASHIETLVGHYAGRVQAWDVVNEAIADGGGLRDTYVLRACGARHIAAAFRRAHVADPAARLYYHDDGAEGAGRKTDAVYALVQRLLDDGVPLHGVGLQMHLRVTLPPSAAAVAANVARLAALGLEVRISEMDVRIRRARRVPSPASAACITTRSRCASGCRASPA